MEGSEKGATRRRVVPNCTTDRTLLTPGVGTRNNLRRKTRLKYEFNSNVHKINAASSSDGIRDPGEVVRFLVPSLGSERGGTL